MQDLKDLKRFFRGSNDRGGQAPALRARKGVRLAMRRSGAGAPELQSPAPNLANLVNRVNPAPLLKILLIIHLDIFPGI